MITYVNELRTYTCNTDWFLRFFRCNSDECGAIIRMNQSMNYYFIERTDAIFAIIQEDAAVSCNQSPVPSGNDPSE